MPDNVRALTEAYRDEKIILKFSTANVTLKIETAKQKSLFFVQKLMQKLIIVNFSLHFAFPFFSCGAS